MVATYGSNYFIFWGISAFHTFLIRCGSPVEIFILHCVQHAGQPDQKTRSSVHNPHNNFNAGTLEVQIYKPAFQYGIVFSFFRSQFFTFLPFQSIDLLRIVRQIKQVNIFS